MWQFGWMVNLIPDSILIWVYYIILGLGIACYVASKLVSWIPMMGQYKFPVEVIGVVLLVVGSYFYVGYGTEMSWRERVKELEGKVAEAQKKADDTTAKVEIKVVERIKVVEKKVEVVKLQIEKDKEIINADCKVNETAIKDYNAAIADPDDIKGEKK
jgi:hypothetical protein